MVLPEHEPGWRSGEKHSMLRCKEETCTLQGKHVMKRPDRVTAKDLVCCLQLASPLSGELCLTIREESQPTIILR